MAWKNDTSLGHGQQLCEVSSQSKLPVKGYGLRCVICDIDLDDIVNIILVSERVAETMQSSNSKFDLLT